jgi:hypothetical protein
VPANPFPVDKEIVRRLLGEGRWRVWLPVP